MATSGWYPDPGGAPGRFRHWDGQQWSAETTDNPAVPPPVGGSGPVPTPTEPSKRRLGPLVGVLVLIAVIILVLVLVIRNVAGGDPLVDSSPPESTVSGWDDSSPIPTEPPMPSASPTSSGAPQGAVSCDVGDPAAHVAHPADGRIHGGGLSFADPGGQWSDGQSYAYGMSWAHDVNGVDMTVEPGWAALMAVGAVHKDDGFPNPKKSANGIMQCIASSGYYSSFESVTELHSHAVAVNGHRGWSIRSEIRVDRPELDAEGDVAEVVVVDAGVANQLSIFCGFVTIGKEDQIATLDATIAGLRVE